MAQKLIVNEGAFDTADKNIVNTNFTDVYGQLAAISSGPAFGNVAITTVGNGTLTAAGLAAGTITRTGPTAAFTDTTDTAANIIAARTGWVIGNVYEVEILNQTGFKQTIAAGAGVTASGLLVVPVFGWLRAQLTYTGAGAVAFNGIISDVSVNAAGDVPSAMTEQFGNGTATMLEEGNINRQIFGVAGAVSPSILAADNVVAVYSIPANSFDVAGRGVTVTAAGVFAANANTKRIKLWFNATTAVVGSNITGGTLLADTGAVTTNGGGWEIGGNAFKRGGAGANTQTCTSNGAVAGGVHVGVVPPVDSTAVENAAILVAVTIANTTTLTDASVSFFEVNAMN